MLALRGPVKYDEEPVRHPSLKINAKKPFNAEPPPPALVASYVTPVDMFYKRNHGPIPVLDDLERYCVRIGGLLPKPLALSMHDIRKLPKYTIEVTLQVLKRDHGYPLRVVVPGVIGARSVKWLDTIDVIANECQGFFMQKDYKMFPPTVDWDNIKWSSRRPLMDFPIQITIRGYALSGGGRGIERVDISVDGGQTWMEAKRFQRESVPYVADSEENDKWAWVLFELETEIHPPTVIIAKAVDSAANVQPESVESIWNLRGVLNNSWHRVHVVSAPASIHSNL